MKCPSCGADNAANRRFCGACGDAMPVLCPVCGFANQAQVRFCGGCGALIAATPASRDSSPTELAEGELRQATILFADLSGFTRLSGELDPEEVRQILDRYYACIDSAIERHGGTVHEHIGDCTMGVFGAPTARGNDPERAVRAALQIHQGMPAVSEAVGRQLRAHVGVASGEVLIGPGRQGFTINGASVNLASRLTGVAGEGEIIISELVHQAVSARVVSEPLGAVSVKGLERPIQAFRVKQLRAGSSEFDRRPFVGRQGEVRQFQSVLAGCRETRSGQIVHVRGEAGIGKTRLVEEFRRHAEASGFACHASYVLDFGAAIGQDAVHTLVRSLLAVSASAAGESEREAAARRALDQGFIDDRQCVFLNDLLDLPQPTALRSLYDAMNNLTRAEGKAATLAALVRGAAARSALLLTVEDVHWADATTLGQLASLAAALSDLPVILVLTSRIEGDPLARAWRRAAQDSPMTTIDLGPLRRSDALELARELASAGESFVEACVARAEGNPLFLEQLLRSDPKQGAGGVPPSVQSLVQARLDALTPEDRRALQAASVFGQRFTVGGLRALIERPAYECKSLIENLLVRRQGDAYFFAHALIREAVYLSLIRARRRELHRRVAAWFGDRDPILRAEHLDRADDPAAPRAYLEAAQAQADAYRPEQALGLVERGLAIARSRADIYPLSCLRGELLQDTGAMAQSIDVFRRALELAETPSERSRAWLGCAQALRVTDQLQDALAALARAEEAARSDNLLAELSRIHYLRGNLYFPQGNLDGCAAEHEKALAAAREAGSAELEARALGGLGDAYYARGRMIVASEYFDRCVALAQEHGFGRIEVANRPMIALMRWYQLDLPGSLAEGVAALAAAERVGQARAEVVAHHAIYFSVLEQTDFARAERHVQAAHRISLRLGARRFEAENFMFLGEIRLLQGRREEALALLREALQISREAGIRYLGPAILGVLGRAAIDPDERSAALEEGESLLRSGAVSHNYFFFYRNAGEVANLSGEWDKLDRYAEALRQCVAPDVVPWVEFFATKSRALARRGRGEPGALDDLARLRAVAERAGMVREAHSIARLLDRAPIVKA
ncbi:MAG TPA: adenylate/guanylate cyclase domain-containing protein [Alphaproteobacteria bacterium]|nr:adenylate/guanylate cyclase domain-containing protein [Alphaproteobacteria bacterium]